MSIPAALTGFVGAEPTVQHTESGKTVTRLRLACKDEYRDATGQFQERDTFWVVCEGWGHVAEAMATYSKGTALIVVGQWRQSDYEADGQKRSARFVAVTAAGVNDAIPSRSSDAAKAASSQEDHHADEASEGEAAEENPL
ncbi:single-stranded DNA-binding protein (plasmid) [Kocuria marina subsp. indica]|uniref:single-stranded DNA-binding protein n=1 Tax=Kocuria marina TaxID=223184 RepID=UPI00103C9595|nr:single-stranded DNA-binding protein [Kocuria indica]QBJ22765.1 single-stranded DNA-binding protein [Kocuria indica]